MSKTLGALSIAAVLLAGAAAAPRAQDLGPRLARVASLQGLLDGSLLAPLKRNQVSLGLPEYDVMTALSRRAGVSEVLYLNAYGEVRWSKDPKKILRTFDSLLKDGALAGEAVKEAWRSKRPAVGPVKGSTSYHLAIPLVEGAKTLGVLALRVDDRNLAALVEKGDALFPPAAARTAAPSKAPQAQARSSGQHFLAGMLHFQKGDRKKAQGEWRLSLRLDPSNEDAKEGLARLKGG